MNSVFICEEKTKYPRRTFDILPSKTTLKVNYNWTFYNTFSYSGAGIYNI